MMQDGGVRRHASVSSLDVKLTGFGDYDAALVEAITQRWYDLLDSQRFALDRTGKVVLQFRLNYDGTISDMKVAQTMSAICSAMSARRRSTTRRRSQNGRPTCGSSSGIHATSSSHFIIIKRG